MTFYRHFPTFFQIKIQENKENKNFKINSNNSGYGTKFDIDNPERTFL